jgi:hypothetical protein
LAGCGGGGQSKVDRAMMEVELSSANVRITGDVLNRESDLPAATNAYVGLLRKYRSALGKSRTKRLLVDRANELFPWCHECAATLDRERQLIG